MAARPLQTAVSAAAAMSVRLSTPSCQTGHREIDAPVEGLAIDDDTPAPGSSTAPRSQAVQHAEGAHEKALAGQHADDLPRSMPMCRSMPNSARRARAVELAAKLTPVSR
jgi:hypothetical protein